MSVSPLEGVALEYIKDAVNQSSASSDSQANQSIIDKAFEVLQSVIRGLIPQEQGRKQVEQLLGTSEPADRIISILNVPLNNDYIKFEYELEAKNSNKGTQSLVKNWTRNEDNRLLAGIHRFGLNNWTKVAEFVGNNRTKAQCSQRWMRGLDPKIVKGPWTEEEEEELFRLISIYGDRSWKKIATLMPNRSDAQCRYHYLVSNKAKSKKSYGSSYNKKFSKVSNLKHSQKVEKIKIPTISSAPSLSQESSLLPDNMINSISSASNDEFLLINDSILHDDTVQVVANPKVSSSSFITDEEIQKLFNNDNEWEIYSLFNSPFLNL